MAKNTQIELISVTVKINGKNRVFKKDQIYFQGWEYQGDCFSDSGVNMELFDKNGKRVGKTSIE